LHSDRLAELATKGLFLGIYMEFHDLKNHLYSLNSRVPYHTFKISSTPVFGGYQKLEETRDLWRLSERFLGFTTLALKKIKELLFMYNHGSQIF
jgi:hypothetical protein